MASERICSMLECGKPVKHLGLCSGHYEKLRRHGDPSVSKRVADGAHEKWLRENSSYSGTECLIWPFSSKSNGYGMASLQGKGLMAAHRFMCILVNGNPPTNKHVSAHSCNNGQNGCVSPKHVRWATYKENSDDKYVHGTVKVGVKNHNAKLTAEKARAIYNSKLSIKETCAKFNVGVGCVSSIKNGATWGWLTGHKKYIRPSRAAILPSP